MPLDVQPLHIPDVMLITPTIARDERGFFSETYSARAMGEAGVDAVFVQDNQSLSRARGVLRGLHYQVPPFAQGKLVRVLHGSILDVAVDIREGSPTFGRHVRAVVSAQSWSQIWVPPGFAHGFCTLEPDTEVFYKVTAGYAPAHERGIAFDDPDLDIDWPIPASELVLSEKDRRHPRLRDLPVQFPAEG